MRRSDGFAAALVLLALAAACSRSDAPSPPPAATPSPRAGPVTARWDLVDQMHEDLHAPRHAADGGGRAWIEADGTMRTPAIAGAPGRWTIVYEAGALGVAAGGMVYLQVSPFWGWSTPQVMTATAPGYTEVSTDASGVTLEPQTLDQQLLGIAISGRPLRQNERIRITYGAGDAGALADRFAERDSAFWIAVDGDGDGVRQLLPEHPLVDVLPGPPARVIVTLPSTAHAGQNVRLTIALLDARGDAGVDFEGSMQLTTASDGLTLPPTVTFSRADGGCKTIEVPVQRDGLHRVRATVADDVFADSNPMLVAPTARRVLWADLHGHSNYSDGTGLPEDFFRYARDVAALDVVALTDHDHWGMQFLDQHPQLWQRIQAQNAAFNQSGRFVTLLGFEWTSWIYGHRHVLFFDEDGPIMSSMDDATSTPTQLWEKVRGYKALTIAHHSAGGPIAVDWSIRPDPQVEPVTEIVSVHGSSEAEETPGRIYSAVPGNFVRDALKRGYRFGFIGSGDSHDGHPGLAHLAGPSGGLAAIFSEEVTRDAIYAALRERRTYATNGPRIFLSATLDGQLMGALVPARDGPRKLDVRIVAPAPISHVDIIRNGAVGEYVVINDTIAHLERELGDLKSGDYIYIRVVQDDGGAAWSSPFYVE